MSRIKAEFPCDFLKNHTEIRPLWNTGHVETFALRYGYHIVIFVAPEMLVKQTLSTASDLDRPEKL